MSITDELRKYVKMNGTDWGMNNHVQRILAIADRIDKEHAKAVERARMDGMDETFGDGWVKLPADADGVPIYVGDEVRWPDGETADVVGIGGSRAERLFYLNENGRFCWGIAENCRHVKPDSWESIILDAVNVESLAHDVPQVIVDKLVERCRRLAES